MTCYDRVGDKQMKNCEKYYPDCEICPDRTGCKFQEEKKPLTTKEIIRGWVTTFQMWSSKSDEQIRIFLINRSLIPYSDRNTPIATLLEKE